MKSQNEFIGEAIALLIIFAFLCVVSDAKGNTIQISDDLVSNVNETVVFFIPDNCYTNASAYIYDSERNELLICYRHNENQYANGPDNRETQEWTVLPGKIRAYLSPFVNSKLSDVVLGNPQKILASEESLIESDNVKWVSFEYEKVTYYLPEPLLAKRSVAQVKEDNNIPIGAEKVSRDQSLPPDYKPDDLVIVDQKWNYHTDDYPKYMRIEAAQAIETMLAAAQTMNIKIRIFSAYRSYEKQRYLYLREVRKNGLTQILVAKPGHSEHQLGTAADLCGLNPGSVGNIQFGESTEGKWLFKHCNRFGFIISYRKENAVEHGYAYEPWHFRYIGK